MSKSLNSLLKRLGPEYRIVQIALPACPEKKFEIIRRKTAVINRNHIKGAKK